MRVFLTGGSGFIGSALIPELIRSGHQVLALARSDTAAQKLAAAGVAVHRGSLTDAPSLRAGASACDGVIHCAFSHDDWNDRAGNCEKDRDAIEVLGEALAGSNRPLVVTSGAAYFQGGISEERLHDEASAGLRARSEQVAFALAERGVKVSIVRLPPSVHDAGDHGFVPMLIEAAKKSGRAGYIGDGANRWPAVHRLDAARLFRIAIERAPARSILHAIGDEGIATREIAGVIARKLDLPSESVSKEHFAWLGAFYALDCPAAAPLTRERFGWKPENLGLLADMERNYFG